MKKRLIPALLVVSAAFVPGLRNAVGFPDRVCEIAQEAARPLFWHFWDRLLACELAGGTEDRVRSEEPTWHAALPKDVVACILFDIILKHAFDGSLSVGKRKQLVLRVDFICPDSTYSREEVFASLTTFELIEKQI
jgi:hypothetical protein